MSATTLRVPNWVWLSVMLLLAPLFFTALFIYDLAGQLLMLVCAAAVVMVMRIMARATAIQRRGLWQIVTLMLLGTLFWAFAQQGGSSISLFIDHYVDRQWFSGQYRPHCSSHCECFCRHVWRCDAGLAGKRKWQREPNSAYLGKIRLRFVADWRGFYPDGTERPLRARIDGVNDRRAFGYGARRTVYRPCRDGAKLRV